MSAYRDGYWWSNDGLRLHYRDYPADASHQDRPPIICLHGLTRNARDFENVASRLAGQWRVIAPDFRGRGESAYAKDPMSYVPLTYVQDIEALLAELKIEHFISFGTSLGGIVTMLLASTRPGRVVGALLNDVGPKLEAAGLARIRDYVGQGRTYPTWMHAARDLADTQRPTFPEYDVADWLVMAKRVMKLTPGGRIIFDYDMKIAEPFLIPGGEAGVDLWPAFEALKPVPTLLVRGADSDILSAASAQEMMAGLDHGAYAEIGNVGHAPTLEEPEAVAAIDTLLAKVVTQQQFTCTDNVAH